MQADADVRAVTAKIAGDYNSVPYKPLSKGSPGLDPALLFGLAGVYGDFPMRRDMDVLDLGCGSGGQLLRLGGLTTGRILGVDISRVACDDAIRQCKPLGSRCAIHCADLLDFDLATLGQFDLIYLLGVYFVVPDAVQKRLLEVIAACLKPGGVAVISYYTGEVWRQYDAMRKTVHAVVDRTTAPAEQIKAARRCLQDMAAAPGQKAMTTRIITHALAGDETALFHEIMGEVHAHATTTAFEEALAPAGIHFLNWLQPGPFASPDPKARAAAADRGSQGGYLYGVFGKYDPALPADWSKISWITGLRRAGASAYGIPVFRDTAASGTVEVMNTSTAAALDVLARGPVAWTDIQKALAAQPAGLAYLAAVKRDFLTYWQAGQITPLAGAA